MPTKLQDRLLNWEVPCLQEISRVFGEGVLQADGSLNRVKLGEIIFNDEEMRQKLNSIIHPAIRQEMLKQKDEWLAGGANTVIMDIPLLFESKLQSFVDKIIVVSVTPEIQKERLIARNVLSEEEADSTDPIPAACEREGKGCGCGLIQ